MAKTRQQRKAERRRRQAEGSEAVAAPQGEAAQRRVSPEAAEPTPLAPDRVEDRDEAAASAEVAASEAETPVPQVPKPVRRAAPAAPEAKPEPKRGRRVEGKQARSPRDRSRVIVFLGEVRAELRRVQWPDRQHLVQATGVVLVTVAIAAAYLGLWDLLFNRLVQRFL